MIIPNENGVIPADDYVPEDLPSMFDVAEYDEDEPTPEQIHAAMDAAEKAKSQIFQPAQDKPKRTTRPKRKTFNARRKKNDA